MFDGAQALANDGELLAAWLAFERKVKDFLLSEVPDYRTHPKVGPWINSR